MADPEIRFAMERDKVWIAVKKEWEEAEQVAALGVADFAKAMASRGFSGKRVSEDVLNTRTISCTGRDLEGNTKAPPCPSLTTGPNNTLFCSACGCPQGPLSKISGPGYSKLMYPTLSCPRKRPGFSNHEGATQPPEGSGSQESKLPESV